MALPVPVEPPPVVSPPGEVIPFPGRYTVIPRQLPINPELWGDAIADWLPHWDPEVNYNGQYAYPLWTDVYDWAKEHISGWFTRPDPGQAPTVDDVQNAAEAAAGASIKALGGFINHAVAQEITDARYLESQIANADAVQETINSRAFERIEALEQGQAYIAQVVVPVLRAEILQARTDAINVAAYDALANRQWAVDHILKPLTENLGKVDAQAKKYTDGRVNAAEHDMHLLDNAQTAKWTSITAALGVGIATLNRWVDDCGEPMCQTQGPKTDLGKLLKGLNVAAWLALAVELGDLTEGDIEALIARVLDWASRAITEFETLFFTDGKTLAATIAGVI